MRAFRLLPNSFLITSFPLAQTLVTVAPLGGPVSLLTCEHDLGDTGESKDFLGCQSGAAPLWALGLSTGRAQGEGDTGVQRGERTAAGGLGGSTAKPARSLAALLSADSPSRSHLFPFHSSPTCLPPALLPGRQLLPAPSLHARLPVALKEGDHCLWGCENLRHPRAWNHQNGLAEGASQVPPSPSSTYPSSLPGPRSPAPVTPGEWWWAAGREGGCGLMKLQTSPSSCLKSQHSGRMLGGSPLLPSRQLLKN